MTYRYENSKIYISNLPITIDIQCLQRADLDKVYYNESEVTPAVLSGIALPLMYWTRIKPRLLR